MIKLILLWMALLCSYCEFCFAGYNVAVDADGVKFEVCDVRTSQDNTNPVSVGSLRERLSLFNKGTHCLYGIYFLKPLTIKLTAPLIIKGRENPLQADKAMAGTYLSGLDEDGFPLPVVIDGSQLDLADDECMIMIEGGLKSFQQIHDITIKVPGKRKKAICDENGNSLMRRVIPQGTARACPSGSLAKNCDFKNVSVVVTPIFSFNPHIDLPTIDFPTSEDEKVDLEPEEPMMEESPLAETLEEELPPSASDAAFTSAISIIQDEILVLDENTDVAGGHIDAAGGCSLKPQAFLRVNTLMFYLYGFALLYAGRFVWRK